MLTTTAKTLFNKVGVNIYKDQSQQSKAGEFGVAGMNTGCFIAVFCSLLQLAISSVFVYQQMELQNTHRATGVTLFLVILGCVVLMESRAVKHYNGVTNFLCVMIIKATACRQKCTISIHNDSWPFRQCQ